MIYTKSDRALLGQYRQQFPALMHHAYFNYGGQGTMPQGAIDAIFQAHEYIQRSGPFSSEVNSWIKKEAQRTRSAIATELGVAVETIALTENVSAGCNIALWGIDWQAGDHLLVSDCEHPGILAAISELQQRFELEVSTCPLMATLNQGDPLAVIQSCLRPRTRLVVLSHILWNTGQVLPLAEIVRVCQAHGTETAPVRILVDAAQSVGMLPLNLAEIGVDFYAFTGHKWWCGPAGLGGLYVAANALSSLRPTFISWRGITTKPASENTVENAVKGNAVQSAVSYESDARRYELATSDYPLFIGLQAAIAIHHQWGSAAERYQQIQTLSHLLWHQLREIPQVTCLRSAPPAAGLVSFQLENGKHAQLVQTLERQGFFLRTILKPDCIRACVHYFTSEDEIDRLVAAIKKSI